ncbi:hypothetical protein [Halolamina sediminis]|uniref:hypothetical protein n=1 Tax=Halolamina sediminis TaxID=1480675 RepID=UPI0012AB9668|nr:hypothetical protein [Halolamina sediminis]
MSSSKPSSRGVSVGFDVAAGVAVGVPVVVGVVVDVGVGVGVPVVVGVVVGVGVGVAVAVGVGVGVAVAVGVGVGVAVAVGVGVCVAVAVGVGVGVAVAVGVAVGIGVAVGVGVTVAVGVAVTVAVGVAVGVGVTVAVGVGVAVGVAVGVSDVIWSCPVASPPLLWGLMSNGTAYVPADAGFCTSSKTTTTSSPSYREYDPPKLSVRIPPSELTLSRSSDTLVSTFAPDWSLSRSIPIVKISSLPTLLTSEFALLKFIPTPFIELLCDPTVIVTVYVTLVSLTRFGSATILGSDAARTIVAPAPRRSRIANAAASRE